MTDKAEPKAMGGEEIKKKQSLESSVTLGLGYGKKKKRHVEAFYSAVWPVLKDAGWTLVKGEGDEEGAIYFLPPGVTMSNEVEDQKVSSQQSAPKESPAPREEGPWDCASCGHTNESTKSRCTGAAGEGRCMAWRGGKRCPKPYFNKVRDVIERVLEKKNEVEAKAAHAYLELVPDASGMFTDQKGRKTEPSPPRNTRKNDNHFSWKDVERTHYEKTSSRVGTEFQVSVLPAAGSHTSTNADDDREGGAPYERVWDPEKADELGKLDFVHTRVRPNKKESAYDLFHSRGYWIPGFYEEVSNISPTDCSDWTKEDKDHFRSAVFEHHENMKEVSKMTGKPISECITYYLVKFKRTKSYKSLKRSMKRKANVSEGNAGTLVCNECGKGGMLIACDTCEAHYHLPCASPPLESIPDGTWNCGNCKRETRSMLSSQDEMSCNTDQNPTEGTVGISMEGSGDNALDGSGGTHVDGSGYVHKRKLDSLVDSTQEKTESISVNGTSGHKRMQMCQAKVETGTAV